MTTLSSNVSNAPLARRLAQVAAIWVASDLAYYLLLPALGAPLDYNASAVAITLFYVFWTGIAAITFWDLYAGWSTGWRTFQNRLASYLVWTFAFAGCIAFATYVLPLLPQGAWTQPFAPPDVRVATSWYFLPKSVDILFQQLLVLALVLALAARRLNLRTISLTCALLFGATHMLLAFGDVPWRYVIRFMVAATAFGFLFPILILRVPHGLAYSYVLHWLYYAFTVVMPRIFTPPGA